MSRLGTGDARDITTEQLRQLIRLLDASDVTELLIEEEISGLRLALRKPDVSPMALAMAESPAPATGDDALEAEAQRVVVTAGLVGIFHMGSRPNGPPLIAKGDRVVPGQTVAAIETLGLFNEVEAPCAGTVVSIEVKEGQPVEYGQPLMVIEPLPDQHTDGD